MKTSTSCPLLFIDQFDRTGGAQLFLVELVSSLAEFGWSISVTSPQAQEIARRLLQETCIDVVGEAPCPSKSNVLKSLLKTLSSIYKLRKNRRTNHLCIANSLPGALAARLIEPDRNRRLYLAHRVDLSRVQRFILSLANPIVVYSVSKFAIHYYSNLGWKSKLVQNGFRLSDFTPQPRPLGPVLQVGILGRIEAEKGIDDFVELIQSFQQEEVRFHVFGESFDKNYEDKIRGALEDRICQDQVVFHGFVKRVQEACSKIDLLLNLSHVRESFGRGIVEAGLCGVPALSYRNGGPEELILQGKSGMLCKNLEEIEDAIRLVLADSSLLEVWGKRARELAEHFDIRLTTLDFSQSLEKHLRTILVR